MHVDHPDSSSVSIAIIGAGPVGLSLALLAAAQLPNAHITTYDARQADHNVHEDPRTLALSLGSIQLLQRLQTWSAAKAQPILTVNISQQQPSLIPPATVQISAQEMQAPMLGAVISYGNVLGPLQQRWLEMVHNHPQRFHACFGHKVKDIRTLPDGQVEVDAQVLKNYDLVIVAEGGIFSEQVKKPVVSDYHQNGWIGTVTLEQPLNGMAFERFTANGPAALLPIGMHEAALVWCQPSDHDEVATLTQAQRLAVLNTMFPPEAGRLTAVSDLKPFALGLNAERTLVHGRTVRIGNAAQTLHPVAGQGLNLGLRDAYVLVEQLARHENIDQALKRAAFSRLPDRWGVMGVTELLARGFTWDVPLLPELRNLGLGAMQKISPLRRLLARRMMFGWR